jgi:phospholipase C
LEKHNALALLAVAACGFVSCAPHQDSLAVAPRLAHDVRPASVNARPNDNVLVNGGFEAGSLPPWTAVGGPVGAATVVSSHAHSGRYSAFMGTTSGPPVNGLTGIAQAVTIPSGGVLSFWYLAGTNDKSHAQEEVLLRDGSGRTVYTCWSAVVTTHTWTQQSCDVSAFAGQPVSVTIGVNDNGKRGYYVHLDVDDVVLAPAISTPTPIPTATPTPTPSITPTASPTPVPTPTPAIQHVVVIIQENRSVDDLFQGFPGANTASSGVDSSGQIVQVQSVPLEAAPDPAHSLGAFLQETNNGKMDGWPASLFAYVPQNETQPYWSMASQYVFADNTFSSNIDESFASHQYYIAAQANNSVNNPTATWGCDGGPSDVVGVLSPTSRTIVGKQYPCFDYNTLADELDGAHLSWRYYAPGLSVGGHVWSAYQAVRHIRFGADWAKVISPETNVLNDIANGILANVTWVTPSDANSDHPGTLSNTGPSWVASVVNAIGQQPSLWQSTAIFVVWDDWGGWWDHVPPPYLDNDGAGIRVPMIVVSPFAKNNYVSHVQYESTSIVRFIEDNFGLPTMTQADARATDPLGDCFNFPLRRHAGRRFTRIAAPYSRRFFLHQRPSTRAPDDD